MKKKKNSFKVSSAAVVIRVIRINFILQVPEQYGPVRMIGQGPGNMLLVGTIRNCILQGTMDVNCLNFSPVVEVCENRLGAPDQFCRLEIIYVIF